jgi:hypothetical protein
MVQRASPLFKEEVIFDFDRDSIVRAALRAYIEASLYEVGRLSIPSCDNGRWEGDFECGAFLNADLVPSYNVVAWNEVGVVGLGFEAFRGPLEQFDLAMDAATNGPDDVRGAVPDLPEELESVFVRAVGLLDTNEEFDVKLASIGFWVLGERVGGTLFSATHHWTHGAVPLGAWGLLNGSRLLRTCSDEIHNEPDKPEEVPVHEVIDAVLDRMTKGPTELTPAELEILLRPAPDPKELLRTQRMLQQVGITWSGSPEIPVEPPEPRSRDTGYLNPPTTSVHTRNPEYRTYLDRDSIIRAALRAYIESVFAKVDPLNRHPFAALFTPRWTGDLKQGAFRSTDESGSYEVLAWSEAGVVGLAYEKGYGPVEHLELPITDVKGSLDDVRIAVTEMPRDLEPTLVMAVGLLDIGAHGEKLASVGYWLHGELVGGSLYEYYHQKGKDRLRAWGRLKKGQLRRWYQNSYVLDLGRTKAAPIQALVDALTERALVGPTELTADEIAILLPTPPDPEKWQTARQMLQLVGIAWAG